MITRSRHQLYWANRRLAIKPVVVGRFTLFQQATEKPFSPGSFEGIHFWEKSRTSPEDAQKGRPARPQ
jgi:hypothetical protein